MLSAIRTQLPRIATRQFSTSSPVLAKNIYVGNLSWDLKEDDLRETFKDFGEVNSVKIVTDRLSGRSRGFAFVEMAEDGAADCAIEELNGKEVSGRPLTVNESTPREQRPQRDFGGERRSYGNSYGGGRDGGNRGGYSRRSYGDRDGGDRGGDRGGRDSAY